MTTQSAFHSAQDSRRFPTSSIGDFRVALHSLTSDISDMDQATLIARIAERLATLDKDPTPLGIAIGRSRDYINDILNGRKKSIPNDVLTPLAVHLECDERYFTDSAFTAPGRPRRAASPEDLARHDAGAEKGFYALAWREYKNLQPQDVADDTGMRLALVSDIENGRTAPDAQQMAALATAFGTNPGMLRTNPFLTSERVAKLISITEGLDPGDQSTLIDMAEALERRRAG